MEAKENNALVPQRPETKSKIQKNSKVKYVDYHYFYMEMNLIFSIESLEKFFI